MEIKKLSCCLAKPMNAIRDLAAKVNEIIAAHNDHLENHPSGGGGGENPVPPPSNTSVCVAIVTTEMNPETGVLSNATSNKTFQDLKETYNNEGLLWCRVYMVIPGLGMVLASFECYLHAYVNEEGTEAFIFEQTGSGDEKAQAMFMSDGSIMVI